jgi:hypothetical protein
MTKHQLFILVCIGAALAACSKKKETPASEKPVAGSGSASASGAGSASAAPSAGGTKIGPIDLTAATVDLAALFPGAKLTLHPTDDSGGRYDSYEFDTVDVTQGDKNLLVIELAPKSDRILNIIVLDPSIATPEGLDVGKPITDLAAKHADVTCIEDKMGTECGGPSTGQLGYELAAEDGTGAEWGTEVPIAKVPKESKIGQVHWTAADGATGPTLTKRPPLAADAGGGSADVADDEAGGGGLNEGPHKPTSDEIDRCARVYAVTLACGIGVDEEFGWVKADKKKLTRDQARKECSPEMSANEDGESAFPVPILAEDKVMKITVAALDGCAKLKSALDEVAPGMGPAGYDPSK